ncbi:hypothetical protein [Rhizobium indicum]|nr:hypothetical protein [Rhizobium indicum]
MMKSAESKPKRTAANANAGAGRDKARRSSGKSPTAPAAQRKAN